MQMVRAQALVRGKVQGVYYRASAQKKALSLQLTGWVRNCPDGSVEGIIEGGREQVEAMLAWCKQGPPGASVERLTFDWAPYTGEYRTFLITKDKE